MHYVYKFLCSGMESREGGREEGGREGGREGGDGKQESDPDGESYHAMGGGGTT